MSMIFLALVIRLVSLQVFQSDELSYFAKRQQTNTEIVRADRGFIYDRNDVLLVYNRNDYSFYVDLRMLPAEEKQKLAKLFSKILNKNKSHYLRLLQPKGKTICLEKKVPYEKSIKLSEFNHPAFFYIEEPTSVFHYGSVASHVLGYVNGDYKGTNGISESFDNALNGQDGFRLIERNAMGDIISISEDETISPSPGDDIYLTIDKRFQSIAEEELKKGLNLTTAESATCIIMNPNTGEILAMANVNDYDPNSYWKFDDYERKNRSITDSYEPGSTFKAFTIAALFEEEACNENEVINVENGVYKFKNNYIHDTHKFESLTVKRVIEESSNIGIAKLILRLDDEKFYQHIRNFGFGTYTSVSLPGEVNGKLTDLSKWTSLTRTYMSFGYSISVTPLQLTTAFCALVNGGILYQPQIVKKQVDKNHNTVNLFPPVFVRKVISEKTSQRIRSILSGVVKNGTGNMAKIDSIEIGGKTGTSKITVNGKYSNDLYNSSFVGFYPVDNPELVCYVLINKPKGKYYGGLVAAPVFKNIVERIIGLKKIKSNQYDSKSDYRITQNKIEKDNEIIINKSERPDENTNDAKNVFASNFNNKIMPDLRNKTIKEALLIMNEMGIRCTISGSGVVVEQSISPGSSTMNKKSCNLKCSQISSTGARIY